MVKKVKKTELTPEDIIKGLRSDIDVINTRYMAAYAAETDYIDLQTVDSYQIMLQKRQDLFNTINYVYKLTLVAKTDSSVFKADVSIE